MKVNRLGLLSLVAIALLSGCGKSTSLTDVPQDNSTPSLDTTAPPSVEGLGVSVNEATGGKALVWSQSSAPDVARYQVFKFSPDPTRMDSYVLVDEAQAPATRSLLMEVGASTTEYYRVRAIDQAGNSSPLTTAFAVEVSPLPVGGSSDPDPSTPPLGHSEW